MSKKSKNKSKGGRKSVPSPSNPRPSSAPSPKTISKPRRALPAVLIATLLAGAGLVLAFYIERSTPNQEMTIPRDLDDFEPQLKAYLLTFIQACESKPNDVDTLIALAQAYEGNRLWVDALRTYRAVVELAPRHRLVRYHLAMALDGTDAHDQALDEWRRLLADHPDFAPAHHRMGYRLLERGDIQEAARAFQRTIDLLPDVANGYVGLGDAKVRMGQYAEAVLLLEKGVRLKPSYKMAHYLLGMAYRGLGRMDEARRELARGADGWRQYVPDDWTPLLASHLRRMDDVTERAQDLARAGRSDEAVLLLEDMLEWHPDNGVLLNNLASIYLERKEWDRASQLLLRAERLDNVHFATFINLSSWALKTGQLPQALSYADRAMEMASNVAQSYITRYHALSRLNRIEEALDCLHNAVRLDVTNPSIAIELGNRYMMLQDPAQALPQYREAIRRDPFQINPYLALCEANSRLKRFDDADAALVEAEQVAPRNPQIAMARRRLQQARNR